VFNLLQLLTWRASSGAAERDGVKDTLRRASAKLPGVRNWLLEPSLPGSYEGGDLIWRLSFGSREDFDACVQQAVWLNQVVPVQRLHAVARVDSGAALTQASGARSPGLRNGIYRGFLIRVLDGTANSLIRQFEREMAAMPEYVGSIRNWNFGRVAVATGARGWTHLWEQEFDDQGGFSGEYMMHPYHWAFLDRWFDVECHDRIVDTRVCHVFGATERCVLAVA